MLLIQSEDDMSVHASLSAMPLHDPNVFEVEVVIVEEELVAVLLVVEDDVDVVVQVPSELQSEQSLDLSPKSRPIPEPEPEPEPDANSKSSPTKRLQQCPLHTADAHSISTIHRAPSDNLVDVEVDVVVEELVFVVVEVLVLVVLVEVVVQRPHNEGHALDTFGPKSKLVHKLGGIS